MNTALAFIVVFGLIVFFHEFGHFITSKLVGIRVKEFALGFGPSILKFTKGETIYKLNLIPLGGYNKLAGMEPGEENEAGGFNEKPVWAKTAVVLMGSLMNFLLAFIIYTSVPLIYGVFEPNMTSNEIGSVQKGFPASQAGLKEGDRIVEINGKKTNNWEQIVKIIHANSGKKVNITVKRGAEVKNISMVPVSQEQKQLGLLPKGIILPSTEIGKVKKNSAAQKAKLQAGDRITVVNGKNVTDWKEVRQIVSKEKNKPMALQIDRNGRTFDVKVSPRGDNEVGRIGISPVAAHKKPGFLRSMYFGAVQTVVVTKMIGNALVQLVTGKLGLEGLSGPVGVVSAIGEQAKMGLEYLIYFAAFLSINIGLFNLLPFPALDGGRIVFLVLEAIGIKVDPTKEGYVHFIGFALLLLLMVVMVYRDILQKMIV